MQLATRLIKAYQKGDISDTVEYIDSLTEAECDELLNDVQARLESQDDTALSLFRVAVSCPRTRQGAVVRGAKATTSAQLTPSSVERTVRDVQIGILKIGNDLALEISEKDKILSSIATEIMSLFPSKNISRSDLGAVNIALASARGAADLNTKSGRKCAEGIVSQILQWTWKSNCAAGLVDALSTVNLTNKEVKTMLRKLTTVFKISSNRHQEDFLYLGKQILGLWALCRDGIKDQWVELIRCALQAPLNSLAGDFLCLIEMEVSASPAVGIAVLEAFLGLPGEVEGNITGRDLALVLTIARADDSLLGDAMAIATKIVTAPDDILATSEASGGSSKSAKKPDPITLRRKLLADATCLPGVERSAGTMLELSESWVKSNRPLVPEIGIEAFITVFATNPHARDEVLSTALLALMEVPSSKKTVTAMLSILEKLSNDHRAKMRDHLNRVQSWIDFFEEVPEPYASRVVSILSPFAVLSPAFGDKLLLKLQKMITNRSFAKKSVAVHGLLALLQHTSRASDDILDGVVGGLRVALRRGHPALRAVICSGIARHAKLLRGRFSGGALGGLRRELWRKFEACLNGDGRLDMELVVVDICGEISTREPAPELFACITQLEDRGKVATVLEQMLEPVDHILALIPGKRSGTRFIRSLNVIIGLCAACLEYGDVQNAAEEERLLQTYVHLVVLARTPRGKLKKALPKPALSQLDNLSNYDNPGEEEKASNKKESVGADEDELETVPPILSFRTAIRLLEAADSATAVEIPLVLMETIYDSLSQSEKIELDDAKLALKSIAIWMERTQNFRTMLARGRANGVSRDNDPGILSKPLKDAEAANRRQSKTRKERNGKRRGEKVAPGNGEDMDPYEDEEANGKMSVAQKRQRKATNWKPMSGRQAKQRAKQQLVAIATNSRRRSLMSSTTTQESPASLGTRPRSGRISSGSKRKAPPEQDGHSDVERDDEEALEEEEEGKLDKEELDGTDSPEPEDDLVEEEEEHVNDDVDSAGSEKNADQDVDIEMEEQRAQGGRRKRQRTKKLEDTEVEPDESTLEMYARLRNALVQCLKVVISCFDLGNGSTDKFVQTTMRHLLSDEDALELESSADIMLSALMNQFKADFANSMTVDLSTTCLTLIQSIIMNASDSVLTKLCDLLCRILEKYVMTHRQTIRGILTTLYNCLELEESLELSRAILLDLRDAGITFAAGAGNENDVKKSVSQRKKELTAPDWQARAKRLCLANDRKSRSWSFAVTTHFLSETLAVAMKDEEIVEVAFSGVALAVRDLLLGSAPVQKHKQQQKKKPKKQQKQQKQEEKQPLNVTLGHLPVQTASQALGLTSTLFRATQTECMKVCKLIKDGEKLGEWEISFLKISQRLAELFHVRESGQSYFREVLAVMGQKLPPRNYNLIRAKYNFERFEVAVKELVNSNVQSDDLKPATANAILSGIAEQFSQSGPEETLAVHEVVGVTSDDRTPSRRRGKRLRSRNQYVDEWLGQEDGEDNFADLEEFLVPRDEQVEPVFDDEDSPEESDERELESASDAEDAAENGPVMNPRAEEDLLKLGRRPKKR